MQPEEACNKDYDNYDADDVKNVHCKLRLKHTRLQYETTRRSNNKRLETIVSSIAHSFSRELRCDQSELLSSTCVQTGNGSRWVGRHLGRKRPPGADSEGEIGQQRCCLLCCSASVLPAPQGGRIIKSKAPKWIWPALAVLALAVISYVVTPPTAIRQATTLLGWAEGEEEMTRYF